MSVTDRGRVVDVTTRVAGDELALDAPVGSLVLTLVDVVDFGDEEGGRLTIGAAGDEYTWLEIDDDLSTITLEVATDVAYVVGDRVELAPRTEWVEASVSAGDGDPLVCEVPHALTDRLTDGVREPIEGETVSIEEVAPAEWVVTDVLGTPLVVDATFGVIDGVPVPTMIASAQTSANGKNTIFRQATTPPITGRVVGDTWFHPGEGNRILQWDGAAWVSSLLGMLSLADLAVTSAKLADAAVVTSKIDTAAVIAAKIADTAVTGPKIADLAVGSAKVDNAAIVSAKIADLAVGTAKIADLAVASAKVANAAIVSAKIGDAAIINAKIANAAITTLKVADAAITDAKIGNLDAAKITTGALDAARIAANTITANKIRIADFTNYVNDPEPTGLGTWVAQTGTPSVADTTSNVDGLAGKVLRLTPDGTAQAMREPAFPVQPGDVFHASVWLRRLNTVPTAGNLYLSILCFNSAGAGMAETSVGNAVSVTTLSTLTTTWTEYSAPTAGVTIPAGAVTAQVEVRTNSNATAGGLYDFGRLRVRRKSGGSLIVDGAVTAAKLSATAIDGKTITGATVQTQAAANRGIKIDAAGNALRAYNTVGTEMVTLDGNTGQLTATGSLSTGVSGEVRVSVANVVGSTAGAVLFLGTNDLTQAQIRGSGTGGSGSLLLQAGEVAVEGNFSVSSQSIYLDAADPVIVSKGTGRVTRTPLTLDVADLVVNTSAVGGSRVKISGDRLRSTNTADTVVQPYIINADPITMSVAGGSTIFRNAPNVVGQQWVNGGLTVGIVLTGSNAVRASNSPGDGFRDMQASAFAVNSDVTAKANITNVQDGALDALCSMTPIEFTRDDDETGKTMRGLSAQDVAAFIPVAGLELDAGQTPADKGYDMVAVLSTVVKAFPELRAVLNAARTSIIDLRTRVAALEAKP